MNSGGRPGFRRSNLSQKDQTIQEWNARMSRLNFNSQTQSNANNEIPIQNMQAGYAGGGMGYAGLYQFTGSKQNMNRNSKQSSNLPSPVTSFNKMQPTNFERWANKKCLPQNQPTTIVQKLHISPMVLKEIQDCFARADSSSQDGYLDAEELKGFMACRNCPITHWEAKKLLKNADPLNEKFISLEQIMFLVFHCGLTTPQEKPSDSMEFQNSLRELANIGNPRANPNLSFHSNMSHHYQTTNHYQPYPSQNSYGSNPSPFSSNQGSELQFPMNYRRLIQPDQDSILTENIEMENARSVFEQMAITEEKKKIHETQYKAYRAGLRNGTVVKESAGESNQYKMPHEYYVPTKWDPAAPLEIESEEEESNLEYSSIKANWEEQLSRARKAEEGDTWKQLIKQKAQRPRNGNISPSESTSETPDPTKSSPTSKSQRTESNPSKESKKKSTIKQIGPKKFEVSSIPQEDAFLNNFEAIKGVVGSQLTRIFSERRPIPCPALKGACSKDSMKKVEKKDKDKESQQKLSKKVNETVPIPIPNANEMEAIKKSGIIHSLEVDKQNSTADILFKSHGEISESSSKQEI